MRPRLPFYMLPLLGLIVAAGGCKKGPVPLEGTVTLDGEPLAGATVVFMPVTSTGGKDAPRQANGLTDANGKFKLDTVNQKGAIVGTYKITLQKRVLPPGVKHPDPQSPNYMSEMQEVQRKMVEVVPKIYTDQRTTPLTEDVPPGGRKDVLLKLERGKDDPKPGAEEPKSEPDAEKTPKSK